MKLNGALRHLWGLERHPGSGSLSVTNIVAGAIGPHAVSIEVFEIVEGFFRRDPEVCVVEVIPPANVDERVQFEKS